MLVLILNSDAGYLLQRHKAAKVMLIFFADLRENNESHCQKKLDLMILPRVSGLLSEYASFEK
jgi:hypothetical protein